MCGLLAVYSRNQISATCLEPLLTEIAHRGPDDFGWLAYDPTSARARVGHDPSVLAGSLILGHRRLSIIDTTTAGWQPMSSNDGRYQMVYNGEVYNYLELQAELRSLGHHFVSRSDSEVVLEAWAQWGPLCLERFEGMCAFAILDTKSRKLTLARDFFGIKPLFLTRWRDGIAAASEIGPLLMLPGTGPNLNAPAVYEYLLSGRTDNDARTMLSNVEQLRAAHYIEIDLAAGQLGNQTRYWSPNIQTRDDIGFEEAAFRVREQFLQNVRRHLRSDVPVGVCLSGGIDSSAIAGCVRYLEPDAELHAFCYDSSDAARSEFRCWQKQAETREEPCGSSPDLRGGRYRLRIFF